MARAIPAKPAKADLSRIPADLRPAVREIVAEEVRRALDELRESGQLAPVSSKKNGKEPARASNRVTMVVFSGELDRVMSSLVLATGAAAMGMQVSMFFTFWGLSALRRTRVARSRHLLSKAFTLLTPAGLERMGVSRMNFGGVGAVMLRKMMKDKGVSTPEELFTAARESDVKLIACSMSMDVMGLSREDLIDGISIGGVATCLADATDSRVTLFI